MNSSTCAAPQCARTVYARGWCTKHYQRVRKHGDPLALGGQAERGTPLAYLRAHLNDQTDECVIWPYGTSGGGYGVIYLNGKTYGVHALACEYHHGERPPGMTASHAPVICHTPACFNGRHLQWKTLRENEADKRQDGTYLSGEQVCAANLTRAQVQQIRDRYAAGGVRQRDLASEYGVVQATISFAVRRKTWAAQ